jgi:tetratricopeptide (TPR) repeat protein
MEDSDQYLEILDIRADIYFYQTNYIKARQLHQQIISKTSPTCSPWYHANSLVNAAHLDILMESQGTHTINDIRAAEEVYAVHGSRRILACSWVAAELKLCNRDTVNAQVALVQCLSKTLDIYPDLARNCLAALADIKHRMHKTLETFRWAMLYLAFVQKLNDPIGTSHALQCLGHLHIVLGDADTALNLFRAALQAGISMNIHRLRAECMVGIGDIMIRREDAIQAKEIWAEAYPLFVRSSRLKDAAAVQRRLEQPAFSHSLLPCLDGDVIRAADSPLGVVPSFDNSAEAFRLEKLGTLSPLTQFGH